MTAGPPERTDPQPPRLAPPGRREVGLVNWAICRVSGLVAGTEPPQLFLALGRVRPLLRGWLHFAGRLMPGGSLPRRETEMVILRVATLRGCAYELEHHRRLARTAGLDAAGVERACAGPDAGWEGRDRAILVAADALVAGGDLPDGPWDELRRHLDDAEAVELCVLVAHYVMLATVIAALRLAPDAPVRRRDALRRSAGGGRAGR